MIADFGLLFNKRTEAQKWTDKINFAQKDFLFFDNAEKNDFAQAQNRPGALRRRAYQSHGRLLLFFVQGLVVSREGLFENRVIQSLVGDNFFKT